MTLVQSLRAHGAVVNLKPDGMMQIVPPPTGMILDFGARRQLFADLHQERRMGFSIWCMLRDGHGCAGWPAPQLDRGLALDQVQPCEHVWALLGAPVVREGRGQLSAIICERCGSPGVGV